jgi:hypothetical protein
MPSLGIGQPCRTCCGCRCPDGTDQLLFEDDFSQEQDGWSLEGPVVGEPPQGTWHVDISSGHLQMFCDSTPDYYTRPPGIAHYRRYVCAGKRSGLYLYAEVKLVSLAAPQIILTLSGGINHLSSSISAERGYSGAWYYRAFILPAVHDVSSPVPAAGATIGIKWSADNGSGDDDPVTATFFVNGQSIYQMQIPGQTVGKVLCYPALVMLGAIVPYPGGGVAAEFDDFHFETN